MHRFMLVNNRRNVGWAMPLLGGLVILLLLTPPTAAETLPRQILIEAQIWELSDDYGTDWGVIWDIGESDDRSAVELGGSPGEFATNPEVLVSGCLSCNLRTIDYGVLGRHSHAGTASLGQLGVEVVICSIV